MFVILYRDQSVDLLGNQFSGLYEENIGCQRAEMLNLLNL